MSCQYSNFYNNNFVKNCVPVNNRVLINDLVQVNNKQLNNWFNKNLLKNFLESIYENKYLKKIMQFYKKISLNKL